MQNRIKETMSKSPWRGKYLRDYHSRFQAVLHSYSRSLAQKYTYKPVEKNTRCKHEVCHYSQLIFDNDDTKIYTGEKIASSTNGAEKTGCTHAKYWN